MDVDPEEHKPDDGSPALDEQDDMRAESLPAEGAQEPIATTALSPPAQDSATQTPAPVPQPKPESPYRPNYRPTLMLSGHSRSISSIKFSPDGRMLASCGKYA